MLPTQFATLETEALKLTPEERVLLADHLLASVSAQDEVEEAWAAEIERRLSEIESGHAKLVPAEEDHASGKRKAGLAVMFQLSKPRRQSKGGSWLREPCSMPVKPTPSSGTRSFPSSSGQRHC